MQPRKKSLAPTGLTPGQRACLDAIEAHHARTRVMPSLEELRVSLGLGSRSAVRQLLRQLEERGHIAREAGRERAIRLLPHGNCPRCGARVSSTA